MPYREDGTKVNTLGTGRYDATWYWEMDTNPKTHMASPIVNAPRWPTNGWAEGVTLAELVKRDIKLKRYNDIKTDIRKSLVREIYRFRSDTEPPYSRRRGLDLNITITHKDKKKKS